MVCERECSFLPPPTQATLKTTTPFLLPTTVLPKVEEDADRPRCDSNLVYMPNDRQATFCSCPRFLCRQYLSFFFTINVLYKEIYTLPSVYKSIKKTHRVIFPLSYLITALAFN